MIYNETAQIISNEMIAENIYQAFMHSPKISSSVMPGQFINILPSDGWRHVMRRPMSVASQESETISIIYKDIGPGTSIMSRWVDGDRVDIIGPLGNFWEDYEATFPVLIGGGVGIAPIYYLHAKFRSVNKEHCMIMGARSKADHFIDHQEDNLILMSTDDGSYGVSGTVIDAVDSVIDRCGPSIKIFSCGPAPMMEAVKRYASERSLSCSLALETIMACGIGICQGCTVELSPSQSKNNHSYRERYALACIDGPVFNSEDIEKC